MKRLLLFSSLLVLVLLSKTVTASADGVVQVPEPTSLTLLGAGLASLAGFKIYKNRR